MLSADIAARVRGLIADRTGAFCPDEELTFHIEETCLDFSKRSRAVRVRDTMAVSVYVAPNVSITLPSDCWNLLKITRDDDVELFPLDSRRMDNADLTVTGTPSHYIRDLTGYNLIRLYPQPDTSNTLTLYYAALTRDDQVIPDIYHGTLVWGAAARAIAKSTNPADASKIAQFASAYEAGLREASLDAAKNYSNHSRTIPYRNF